MYDFPYICYGVFGCSASVQVKRAEGKKPLKCFISSFDKNQGVGV